MFVLGNQETENLSDIIHNIHGFIDSRMITVAQFKQIRLKTNHILGIIWQEEIEKKYINDGKFEQFSDQERSIIFKLLKRPTLTNFSDLKTKIQTTNIKDSFKEVLKQVLLDMQPIVDMVESLNDIARIPK